MSLGNIISSSHKEIAGSRTKNRLTVQISYAIQLIMEFYTTDFLVMMDYIEDISVINDPGSPTAIHLYQVKTKSADKQYQLKTVISEEWFQKLYRNAKKYGTYTSSASVVCNTDVIASGSAVFPNEKTSLDDATIQSNIQKIRKAIAEDQGIDIQDVDLSKFCFVRSMLSTKGHKEETEHKFQDFLFKQDPDLQVATAKSIFKILYDILDEKFNNEISESCTDINEIFEKKGLESCEIKKMISCGLAIQIPEMDKLFSEFGIVSLKTKAKCSTQYRQIKIDMFSDLQVFTNVKQAIIHSVEEACNSDIDDMPSLLEEVYSGTVNDDTIPTAYREEYYLKTLIMILAYKYCYGGGSI